MARVAVLGASGYTGAEAVRLLSHHPRARVALATADSSAGQPLASVFPHLARASKSNASDSLALCSLSDSGLLDGSASVDAALACLPPGTTQDVLSQLPESLPIVDLSADFRLRDPSTFASWYNAEHRAPSLQQSSRVVYGLTEFARKSLHNSARLVANPGCYPTCSQLPLRPLLERGIVNADSGVIVDAISGTSGAGRSPRQTTLLCEAGESAKQYGLPSHRHQPEIEQGLCDSNGHAEVPVAFTPHLGAFSRGMVATIHAKLRDGFTEHDAQCALEHAYENERFVRVLPFATPADSNHVRGSNDAVLCACPSRLDGYVTLVCAIDNLMKGATAQAVQNLNVMLGFEEQEGLDYLPMFP